jgi:hypothetical protein
MVAPGAERSPDVTVFVAVVPPDGDDSWPLFVDLAQSAEKLTGWVTASSNEPFQVELSREIYGTPPPKRSRRSA